MSATAWLDVLAAIGLALIFGGGFIRVSLKNTTAVRPLLAKFGSFAEALGVTLGALRLLLPKALAGVPWAAMLLAPIGFLAFLQFCMLLVELLSTSPWHRTNGGTSA